MSTVLIVDDDADIRTMLGIMLQTRGYESKVTANGRDALAELHGGLRPSLILLDLMMPIMNGWDFLAAVKQEDESIRHIPIVILTGYGSMVGNDPIPGTVAVLHKPLELQELFALLQRYC